MIASTLEPLIYLAECGQGLTCVPLFAVQHQIEAGTLIPVLTPFMRSSGVFRVVWPSNHCLTPRVRVFVDFMAAALTASPTTVSPPSDARHAPASVQNCRVPGLARA